MSGQYRVVSRQLRTALENEVTELMQMRWIPQGGICATKGNSGWGSSDIGWWSQAMIFRESTYNE